MIRVQYIRFRDAVMAPGPGGAPSNTYHTSLDSMRKDRCVSKVTLLDGFVFLEDAHGRVRATPWANVVDCEPVVDSQLAKSIGAPLTPMDEKGNPAKDRRGRLEVSR